MGYDRKERAGLDGAIRAMDWNEEACRPGSDARREALAMLVRSGIVEDVVRRRFPSNTERMLEYTCPRVYEKILGQIIVSKEAQCNKGNVWDPRAMVDNGYSFCGFVRKLTEAVCKANPQRVLHSRAIDASSFDEGAADGTFNRVFDTRPAAAYPSPLFEEHPGLTVPRPVGAIRGVLVDYSEGHEPRETVEHLDSMGLWHPSLDALEPDVAVALMLRSLKPADMEAMTDLLPGMARLAAMYAPTQMVLRARPKEERALRRAVVSYARGHHVFEWDVWCSLGTAAARLVAG